MIARPLVATPPLRVVSLVPSVTESLFDLGLGGRLIAVTDFCVHPAEGVLGIPKIGGTKNPRCDEITALHPDLVIANQEENRPQDVAKLQEAGLAVWVTFPRTVRGAIDVLWEMTRLFHVPSTMGQRIMTLEHALDWTRAVEAEREPAPFFCPIWREPHASQDDARWWMTFNSETYIHDLLTVCGGRNIFADRERRYPLSADLRREGGGGKLEKSAGDERDTRYPRVTLVEIVAGQPEVILLPSEPYSFDEADREELMQLTDLPAARNGRVHLVDGSWLTWPGTRVARALQEMPPLFAVA
ncbi:MAG: ABC transporter substrate-binding protein [Chloroflexi bacterium]|nr:ABC transporter substrate-binding protein [Chloroflexota bacterium]